MSTPNPSPLGTDISKLAIPTLPGNFPPETQKSGFWSSNPIFYYLNNVYSSVSEHRQSLNLVNPGVFENLTKEVSRDVFLNQYFFTGLRADLNKAFIMNPVFQISHALSIGSEQIPPYAFSALYANDNLFLQGNLDNNFSLSGRLHYGWDKHNITKATLQIVKDQPTMAQLEQDYQGNDFSFNFKALNPSILDGRFTGVAVGSLLQALTPKLAVGLESVYSVQHPSYPAEAAVSYVARYNNTNWIATAQLQAQGSLSTSFWRKVTENVEAGIETNLQATMKPLTDPIMGAPVGFQPVIEGTTTLGAKYEFRQSVFRGQIDSQGKVACFLEKRILPTVSILFSGELNHFDNTSKLGLGLQLESAGSEELMKMQQGLIDQNGNPIPGAPQTL
ncbi:TOM (translocase of outer membrane) complex component [Komagataella phaffii CBS 7435]|uniref:Translocase of outer membrane 40 kDa subunit n=2 Tax=Komagataella phaffii TaxID=460519 RepID=C4R7R5_KOMPG|nr:Component of the TOM (translocase of outer membrane) complex [Komagataella phaffii GS115]AOA64561.1 GQ67_04740T0 [Komagataella phaffii]KAI0463080.1 translocase of outer mitochondrial membrane [Komagataella kurtzmanii]CAH2450978.1 TOM (translocase of outer membrane) complex component [Komagataella phaffii CBS 7435]AOA69633.1 GQ68_04712T0 [Komagataella phaffii GS115]CAY71640.1 Component of the TOM (translocase of outer membrane) complex [Komagataella phaffii GS115]